MPLVGCGPSAGGRGAYPYDGVLAGTPSFVAGNTGFGSCISLNGSSQWVVLSDGYPPSMNPASGTSWTQQFWFNLSTSNVMMNCLNAAGSVGWMINGNSGNLYAYINGSAVGTQPGGLFNSTWHHVRLSFDGTYGYFFVDGTLQGSATAATWTKVTTPGVCIGAQINGYGNTPQWPITGKMDDVASFSSCLSTTSFTAPTAPTSRLASTLTGLYAFDGNAYDSGPSGSL